MLSAGCGLWPFAKQNGVPILDLSDRADSPLADYADILIPVPSENLLFSFSLTSFAALAHAFAIVLAAVALRTLRFVLNRIRLRLPSSLRHGLANLYRPGNQSAAVLAALGTGVMLILAVYLMQATLLREIRETASPKLPNVFLIDVTTDEVAGVKAFFAKQAGVSQTLDLMPVVAGRLISLNGKPIEELKGEHFPRRMLENACHVHAGECRPERLDKHGA